MYKRVRARRSPINVTG